MNCRTLRDMVYVPEVLRCAIKSSFACALSTLVLFSVSGCQQPDARQPEARQPEVRQSDVHELGSPDYWYYRGEVEVRPSSVQPRPLAAGTGAYCDDSYCAHGSGRLGTDGGLSYEGTFVDGRMDGFGSYSDDFIEYVGHFKEGQPHGQGVLTCLDGRRFEGVFADGWLSGKHWLWLCKT